MVQALINDGLEFYEVLNAFPFLKEKLGNLHLNVSDVKEGETVHDYLEQKKHFSEDEIKIFIRRLNFEIKVHLKR